MKKFAFLILLTSIFLTVVIPAAGQNDSARITFTRKDSVVTVSLRLKQAAKDSIPKAVTSAPKGTTPAAEPDPGNLLIRLLIGAFLGMMGQGMRIIVGIRKQNKYGSDFKSSRLLISLLFGLIVGAIAGALVIVNDPTKELGTKTAMLAVIAAGYAGADFIEGFLGNNKATN